MSGCRFGYVIAGVAISAATFAEMSSAQRKPIPIPVGSPTTSQVVWPPLPEPSRIRYAGVLRSDADLGKRRSGLGFLARLVAGAPPPVQLINRPHDVWVDSKNRLYVTDAGQRRVLRFDPVTKTAVAIGDKGVGRIGKPMGLSGDANGTVYVSDQAGKRVVAFDAAGNFVRAFGGPQTLINPTDVAVDSLGNLVYVADSYLHQVVVFDARDGRLVRRLGRTVAEASAKRAQNGATSGAHGPAAQSDTMADSHKGDSASAAMLGHPPGYSPEPRDVVQNRSAQPAEFRYPSFVAVGRDGRVYVSDALNFRIQVFERDGRFVRAFGQLGDGPGQFARPKGVAVDSEGHVYVADAAFGNVQVFDEEGRLLLVFGGIGRGDGDLWLPEGLHIDAADRVYVSDRFNNRVQIYEYVRQTERASTPEVRRP